LTIDSLAIAIPIWTSTVSPSDFMPPTFNNLFICFQCPLLGPSDTTTPPKKGQRLPSPGRKRHRINSETAPKAQNQPYVKKVTRILQNQPYSNTKYVDIQLKCPHKKHNLSHLPPSSPRMNKGKRETRRNAINACYQSATLLTPSPLNDSHVLGLCDTSKQGPVSLVWRWSIGSGE
jgi:hypothetical protein